MKIKQNYLLSEIEGEYIVIAVGNTESNFNGYLKLNKTSKFLWDCLEKQTTLEDVIERLKNKYSIDPEIAKNDVENFINSLHAVHALEE